MVYGFAVLDSNKLVIKPHDSWADLDNQFYQKVTFLKQHGVKVLIAIGGWNDSKGNKYSRLVNRLVLKKVALPFLSELLLCIKIPEQSKANLIYLTLTKIFLTSFTVISSACQKSMKVITVSVVSFKNIFDRGTKHSLSVNS